MPHLYHLNPGFLTDTSIPENVYTLGRLWADGHVNRDGVMLYAKHGDLEHLLPFLRQMGVGAIYTRQRKYADGRPFGSPSYSVEMNSRALARILAGQGFLNKSLASPTQVLERIPQHLRVLFWRGYCDGDGSIYVGEAPKVTFWGPEAQDWSELIAVLKGLGLGYRLTKYSRKGGKHRSSCLGVRQLKGMGRFCEWLYESFPRDHIGMPRKWEKASALIERAKNSNQREIVPMNTECSYASAA